MILFDPNSGHLGEQCEVGSPTSSCGVWVVLKSLLTKLPYFFCGKPVDREGESPCPVSTPSLWCTPVLLPELLPSLLQLGGECESGSVSPPTWFFFKVVLATLGPLRVHLTLQSV
jgi:hypothetical protein